MYFDSKGNVLQIGSRLAAGGEGEVFRLQDNKDLAVKLYHKRPTADRRAKLAAMVASTNADIHRISCWPTDLVFTGKDRCVAGFVMPLAEGYCDLYKLYNPSSRQKHFPACDWGLLIRAATNTARAFATVHASGHVIGDVNHSSVFVSANAMVKLIDCDSFQISHAEHVYLCTVAEPLHAAPELHGKDLSQTVRVPNHDNFGLAVLVFELLFMGRHPYAGHFRGGDLSLQQKIQRGLFAYGCESINRGVSQPHGTLSLGSLTPRVAELFERAFASTTVEAPRRPTAEEWVAGLRSLEAGLHTCRSDRAHRFVAASGACPWCALESSTKSRFFSVPVLAQQQESFDLSALTSKVNQVRVPKGLSAPKIKTIRPSVPQQSYVDLGKRRRVTSLSLSILCVCVVVGLSPNLFGMYIGLGGAVCCHLISYLGIGAVERRECRKRLRYVEQAYVRCYQEWEARTSLSTFEREQKSFFETVDRLQNVDKALSNDKQSVYERERGMQLETFLRSVKLQPGLVPGIGYERCAVLASHHIASAYDVHESRIMSIHGFGWVMAKSLVDWRRQVESRFAFDAEKVKPEFARLEQGAARARLLFERDLMKTCSNLEQLRSKILKSHEELTRQLEKIGEEVAKAQADLRAL